jgi:hypothetical protein
MRSSLQLQASIDPMERSAGGVAAIVNDETIGVSLGLVLLFATFGLLCILRRAAYNTSCSAFSQGDRRRRRRDHQRVRTTEVDSSEDEAAGLGKGSEI